MLWAVQARGADPECRHWWLVLERYARECFLSASRYHRPAGCLDLGALRAEFQTTAEELCRDSPTRGRRYWPLEGAIMSR